MSVRTLGDTLGLSHGTTKRAINKYLSFKKLDARWFPAKLSDTQKAARAANARKLLCQWGANWAELKGRLITSDETWIRYVAPDTRLSAQEWQQAGEAPPERARLDANRKKVMLTVFWDQKGVIMTDYFAQRPKKGMDGAYYAELIKRLH